MNKLMIESYGVSNRLLNFLLPIFLYITTKRKPSSNEVLHAIILIMTRASSFRHVKYSILYVETCERLANEDSTLKLGLSMNILNSNIALESLT